MRPTGEGGFAPRCALFETLEDRLVLSSQALADFYAQIAARVAPVPPSPVQEVTTVTGNSLAQGGVAAARTDYGFTGAGQTVAVIDSGIAYDHYALGRGFGAGHRVVGGWDFAENDANPYDDGPAGFHGTHVAGIIGSTDATNSGVAPGADLVALRVFDDKGNGNFGWIEKALQWVHDHRNDFANPITTVNLSIGTSWNANTVPNWATLENEFALLKADGIFISVAAGNSFATFKAPGVSYPAASPYVVPVASVGDSGLLSSFSQRNSRVLAAPGERIMSTVPDALFGGNGVPNDFMAASGTSMAAPYVAGASVLLRQAMQFAGISNINEDTLYNTLYNTSDLVFDSATNASYHRINVQRAIDSVMPADDFGSTTATASSVGAIGANKTISGLIGRLNDRDFFSFTAAQSGTMKFNVQGTGQMMAAWTTPTGNTASGSSLSFEVTAGQSYTVGLGSSGGLGRYTISTKLETSSGGGDWGVVEAKQMLGQNMSGDATFKVTASRAGIFTAEAFFNQGKGNIDLELYNADQQLVASSTAGNSYERLDATATAGQTFYLRVRGTNASVDFRLTNLVASSGNQVDVYGTSASDVVSFTAGTSPSVAVNGVSYQFDGSKTVFNFQGGAGSDSITLTGTSAKETAVLRIGDAQFSSNAFRAQARGFETVVVVGGGGADVARLFDSAGDDVFTAGATSATLRGAGFSHTVNGFPSVSAYASAGNDQAVLSDSAGSDRFVGFSSYSFMSGNGFYNYVAGFDSVVATSSGGVDRAELYGTAGSDSLSRTAQQVQLRGTGYSNTAAGFANLRAFGGGGVDEAVFREIGAGDYFYGRSNLARLTGSGTDQQVFDFRTISVTARDGQTARGDVQAVDYVFNQVGKWQ